MSILWKPTHPPFREFKKEVFRKAGEVGQFIYQVGEYIPLRQISTEVPVEQITEDEYQAKFRYIKDCLVRYRELTGYGRGITGVQIGVSERFSVIYTPEKLLIIVNPVILEKSERLLRYPEICMSANPIIAPVIRPAWITFTYFDENGKKQLWNTKDETDMGRIMNRIFQHEIDHMDGFINIDKVSSPRDLILESDPEFYSQAAFEEVLL